MTSPLPRDLGDGLVLRRSTAADADKLAEFNSLIHSDNPEKPEEKIGVWTRDLLTKPHPTFGVDDFTVVEETATGRIVSSLNHISQTWSYDGIPFKVGRPELVGTLPEFRHKRLIQTQFDEVHRWSAERGEMVQGITGIPYYYKRFGYEMGLELAGGRTGFAVMMPALKEGESEPFTFRAATHADIPFLMQTESHASQRYAVFTPRTEALWRYQLGGQSEKSMVYSIYRIIESAAGEPIGFLSHPWFNWDWGLTLFDYELKSGISWMDVTPAVARYMLATSAEYAARDNEDPHKKNALAFSFGSAHPIYEVWREKLPRVRPPYAWYVRVPDLPAFLRHIAPALEKRLANSYMPNHSGKLRLNMYHDGIELEFERGKLARVEAYKPQPADMGDAHFPDRTFLQLLFGYRSIDELDHAYADCYASGDEKRYLLNALFPKKPSNVVGVV
jgi:hypothetical protein